MYIKQKWLRTTLKILFAVPVYLWVFLAFLFGVIGAYMEWLAEWMTGGRIEDIIDEFRW